MNKSVRMALLIVGMVLIVYGIYTLISPEASVEIGPVSGEFQDNSDAYITIVLGIVAAGLSFMGGRK